MSNQHTVVPLVELGISRCCIAKGEDASEKVYQINIAIIGAGVSQFQAVTGNIKTKKEALKRLTAMRKEFQESIRADSIDFTGIMEKILAGVSWKKYKWKEGL